MGCRCCISHSSGRNCYAWRNLSCMLKRRHRNFRGNRAEYFASSKRREPRHGTLWCRVLWSLGTKCPFRDSRGKCFGLSSDRRRWWWLLCDRHQFYQLSQFFHLSLHGCQFFHLGLHRCHLFTEYLILLIKIFHLLFYISPCVVCASRFVENTSGHFWKGSTSYGNKILCETLD